MDPCMLWVLKLKLMSSVMNALMELTIMAFRVLDSGEARIQQGDLEALIAINRLNQNINMTADRRIVKILAAGGLQGVSPTVEFPRCATRKVP